MWAADDPWSAAVGPIVAAQLVAAGFDVVSHAHADGPVVRLGASDRCLRPRPRPRRRRRLSERAGQCVLDVTGDHRRRHLRRTGRVSTIPRSTRSSPRPCRSSHRRVPMPSTSRSTRRCGRPCPHCHCSPSPPCWCGRLRCQGLPTIRGASARCGAFGSGPCGPRLRRVAPSCGTRLSDRCDARARVLDALETAHTVGVAE